MFHSVRQLPCTTAVRVSLDASESFALGSVVTAQFLCVIDVFRFFLSRVVNVSPLTGLLRACALRAAGFSKLKILVFVLKIFIGIRLTSARESALIL